MKARDRKAIKRQVSRELSRQKEEMRESIIREREKMESDIRRHITACDTKQLKVVYCIPGNIPADLYVDCGEKAAIYEISHKLANSLVENGMIEIEKQSDMGMIKIIATVNVYADNRKKYREGSLMTLGRIGW